MVIGLAGWHFYAVSEAYDKGHTAAITERASQDLTAMVSRVIENKVIADQQHIINLDITKAKNEELAPVVQRIYVDRVRVGPAFCGGIATPPAPESAGSRDDPNSSAGLVQPSIERDIRALKQAVEEDLATGRACQAWVQKNGLAP